MRQATLSDLVASDDSQNDEFPTGFDYCCALARVSALRETLKTLTGFDLVLDISVQDASFFTELYARDPVPRSHPTAGLIIETFIAIRFSAFGSFFTIWGRSRERPITEDLRERVAAFVCQHGFVYVPDDILDQPHSKYGTWMTRYFDYL